MKNIKNLKRIIIIILSFCCLASIVSASECVQFPFFKPTQGPLAQLNCDFHIQYEKRIAQIIDNFGKAGGKPVILNLGGTLVFKHKGTTETVDINPNLYHDVKTFAHGAVSIYLILSQEKVGPINKELSIKLELLREHLLTTKSILLKLQLPPAAQDLCQQLAKESIDFINHLLNQKSWSEREINNYYNKIEATFEQTLQIARSAELDLLDKTINTWLKQLNTEERKQLAVVVATSHQARASEISSTYFAKKFGYQYGEGAIYEHNFVVTEGKFDEASALASLARHYLDRELAQLLFHDPERLQRDLLNAKATMAKKG